MFATLFAGQILLFVWRKKHPRSYNAVTLLGMWLIPLGYSIYLSHSRFILIWIIYSLVTGVICRKASRRPLDRYAGFQSLRVLILFIVETILRT